MDSNYPKIIYKITSDIVILRIKTNNIIGLLEKIRIVIVKSLYL